MKTGLHHHIKLTDHLIYLNHTYQLPQNCVFSSAMALPKSVDEV